MASAMDEFDTTLAAAATASEAPSRALARLHAAIDTHLAHEEADVLPLVTAGPDRSTGVHGA